MESGIEVQLNKCANELKMRIENLRLYDSHSMRGLCELLKGKFKSDVDHEFLDSFIYAIDLVDYYSDYNEAVLNEGEHTYYKFTKEEIDEEIQDSINRVVESVESRRRQEEEETNANMEDVLEDFRGRIYKASEGLEKVNNKVKILDIAGIISDEADELGITERTYDIMNKLYDMVLHNKMDIDVKELVSYVA